MAECRLSAYQNAAGLLRNLGYEARAEAEWVPPGAQRPVACLVTCAPEMVIGYAIGVTAEEPEAHLPTQRQKMRRACPGKAGDPLWAHWLDNK